ncbi:hypothetical protein D9613_008310 [Agrocybe pediades]|uniref:Uncharacterized protein n=1 Tax=Agrocybe pediades TaxID=84607 RepID=A0A8H4QTU9_9AGAR|nr:hypothetical protein D9613_008310 [Agrocybe pediades]
MIEVYGETDPIDVPGDSALTSVPTFYSVQAGSPAAYLQMLLSSFSAAALFGSIHCIGWSSKIVFTSHVASLAWRIASVAITASPVVWCLGFVFGYYSEEIFVHGSVLERMFFYFTVLCAFVSAVTIPMYIVARLTLLVLAFVELRHVPPGVLDNIPWANVLPFIH